MILFQNMQANRWCALVMAGWLMACSGCDGGGAPPVSSSSEEAAVHGKIALDGKPPSGGRILFKPANIARKTAPTASAEIAKDGSYTLKTLVGENQVYVESPETKKAMYSVDVFEVKSGDNAHDVSLQRQ